MPRTTTRLTAVAALSGLAASLLTLTSADAAPRNPPPLPLYPAVGDGTDFVDTHEALEGMVEPDWYRANVPFVDLPDEEIEDTYYYRWQTFKESLKYTGPEDGWISSEFLGPVGYSAPNGGIVAAAGHHIYEGRWLRDQRYLDDYVDYWLTGSGSGPKPANDFLGEFTTDWAHQYSFWVADAVLARASVNGRVDDAAARLPELQGQWQAWSPQKDDETGLYWQTPVWDAMEYTASSYQSDDPYHGGEGFRPTLNAYQYGDAKAIAALARHVGDDALAAQYEQSATKLQAASEQYLWDEEDGFYKHVMLEDNPERLPLADREQIGFIPWYFGMAPPENARAWEQLLDPQGFAAPFGPTTVERRSPWYMYDADRGCCRWSGPSWPFATSQTLTAMGKLLADYPDQDYVDAEDFTAQLRTYALTQRRNGQPYVAEAHHPDEDRWIYDGFNRSEDYNHSTFNDIVLSSLIGVRAQADHTVRIAPQVPASWDRFAAENIAYHGRNLTVTWDKTGTAYGDGAGMNVYLDGSKVHTQPTLGEVTVPVPPVQARSAKAPVVLPDMVDDAANVDGIGYPRATASYSWRDDDAMQAIDGQDVHLDIPTSRWTTYRSPNATDTLDVDFGAPTELSDLRTVFYDDGGGVKVPASYDVQYRDTTGTWVNLPAVTRVPATPVEGVNRLLLRAPVTSDAVRLTLRPQPGAAVGVTAFQAWRPIAAGVTATVRTPDDGTLEVTPGATIDVVTDLVVPSRSWVEVEQLLVPRGWTVQRVGPAPRRAAGTTSATWRVTVPADLDPTADLPLRYLVRLGGTNAGRYASDLAATRWLFDPATFGDTVWEDDFSTDRLSEYRISGANAEPAGVVTVAGGALTATSASRSFSMVSAPVTTGERYAVIVEPRSFTETGTAEDSLFTGSADGSGDFAVSWYNHTRRQGGVNVVYDGQGRPAAEGPGAGGVSWSPGDAFATVVVGGRLTTWQRSDGQWSRLTVASVSAAVPTLTLAQWEPSVGLRLDSGTIAIDRMTVLR